jgi:hypothetical protein
MENCTCSLNTGVHKHESNEIYFKNVNVVTKILQLKWVYPHLEDTSQGLMKFIESQSDALNGEGCEAKELCMRYTLNNVASCVFGIDGQCFEDDNSEFKQIANKYLSPDGWSAVKLFLMNVFPFLTRFMSVK